MNRRHFLTLAATLVVTSGARKGLAQAPAQTTTIELTSLSWFDKTTGLSVTAEDLTRIAGTGKSAYKYWGVQGTLTKSRLGGKVTDPGPCHGNSLNIEVAAGVHRRPDGGRYDNRDVKELRKLQVPGHSEAVVIDFATDAEMGSLGSYYIKGYIPSGSIALASTKVVGGLLVVVPVAPGKVEVRVTSFREGLKFGNCLNPLRNTIVAVRETTVYLTYKVVTTITPPPPPIQTTEEIIILRPSPGQLNVITAQVANNVPVQNFAPRGADVTNVYMASIGFMQAQRAGNVSIIANGGSATGGAGGAGGNATAIAGAAAWVITGGTGTTPGGGTITLPPGILIPGDSGTGPNAPQGPWYPGNPPILGGNGTGLPNANNLPGGTVTGGK